LVDFSAGDGIGEIAGAGTGAAGGGDRIELAEWDGGIDSIGGVGALAVFAFNACNLAW
jgi:hypothetical protein